MPLFVYSHKRNNFVFATPGEVNSYAQMRPKQFQLPCWGWGTLMSDPQKGYIKTEGWEAKRREYPEPKICGCRCVTYTQRGFSTS